MTTAGMTTGEESYRDRKVGLIVFGGIEIFLGILCALMAGFMPWPSNAEEQKPEALSAEQILDLAAKAYANCKSYRDAGNVKTVFFEASGNRTVDKPFKTAFIRPDRFRFEYQEKKLNGREYHYVVWRKGKEVLTQWDVSPGVEKKKSLSFALAGAAGVSGGSSTDIPALLLPDEVSGWKLSDLVEAKRMADVELNKAECFRIQGKLSTTPTTYWIDQKTFLILRIDTQNTFSNFRTERTTTYAPVIDGEIADDMLEFISPGGNN